MRDAWHRSIYKLLVPESCTGDEVLHPSREPLDVLSKIRSTLGDYHFSGQYQHAPAPFGGGMVKIDWFRRYTEAELPASFEQVVQSWDIENSLVYLPQSAPWLEDFTAELANFPNSKYDDQVDALSQLLDWFKLRINGCQDGVVEYYIRKAAELRGEID